MTKVAVLMSYYDGDRFVEEQLQSIFNQQVNDDIKVDLFVRDDGSPTSDLAILKKYEQAGKLTLFQESNVGVKLSFYRLMELVADYDYYFFSDQDDIWRKDKIQIMIDELRKHPNDIPVGVYSDLYVADQDAKPTGKLMKRGKHDIKPRDPESTWEYMLRYYYVTGASLAFNAITRNVAVKMRDEFNLFPSMHDAAIGFITVMMGELVFIDEPLVYYRQHGGNLVGAIHPNKIIDNVKNLNKIIGDKVDRIYGASLFLEKSSRKDSERLKLVNKMMTKNFLYSPYYAWKLRNDIYKNHYIIMEFLFVIFGISRVSKYQMK